MSVLSVEASPRLVASRSRTVANWVVARLGARYPGTLVRRRDLVSDPLLPLDEMFTEAIYSPLEQLSATHRQALAQSERLVRELEECAALVISTPMHNFTVPAVLKAWIDQILRLNRTFQTTPIGKIGLLADRPTYVVVSTGGMISGERAHQPDFLTPYLEVVLRTLGIRTIRFFYLEAMPRDGGWSGEAERKLQAWLEEHLPLAVPASPS